MKIKNKYLKKLLAAERERDHYVKLLVEKYSLFSKDPFDPPLQISPAENEIYNIYHRNFVIAQQQYFLSVGKCKSLS